MVAATKYTEDAILDCAAIEIASAGLGETSVASIARKLGAPSGSIYHRFPSKAHLIGALWARTARRYGESLEEILLNSTKEELAHKVVDFAFEWSENHADEVHLLTRHRLEDFKVGDWPQEVLDLISEKNQLMTGMVDQAANLHGVDTTDMGFAVLDIPSAAARRAALSDDERQSSKLRSAAIRAVDALINS